MARNHTTTIPLGYPRREIEWERRRRINHEVSKALVDAGFTCIEATSIVDTIVGGLIPRLSIDYEPGDDDKE